MTSGSIPQATREALPNNRMKLPARSTPSQEPAAPGHLPDPRHARGGLAAKWKALLFMAGVLFLFPLALIPTNWLSARGSRWSFGVHHPTWWTKAWRGNEREAAGLVVSLDEAGPVPLLRGAAAVGGTA